MAEINKLLVLVLSALMLMFSSCASLFSLGENAAPDTVNEQSSEQPDGYLQYPAMLYSKPYQKHAHRLTSYTMDYYSKYTGKTYFHNEAYSGMRLYNGVDVSAKQNDINWFMLSEAIDFAFIRVGYRGYSEGQIFNDKNFYRNIRSAIRCNVPVGVYFYSQATNVDEIREEARLIIESIDSYEITLPVVLDFEYAEIGAGLGGRLYDANLSMEETTEMCRTFCEIVRNAGYTPMIYANSFMLNNKINSSLLDCLIWIAYPAQTNGYAGDYAFWQYSWVGDLPGISGPVDCNFMYSTDKLS